MIASTQHQSLIFFLPLAKQVALLKDDLLEAVDPLLNDPALLELVRQCLASRSPQSTSTGRPGISPDRLLRSCVLKHIKGWSFRELERELCSNLIYRRFTHYDGEATPDFTSFSRLFALLSPSVTQEIHQRVVEVACEHGVAEGRKLKTDTTCVEASIHYPTDSSLLADGIRVLSRGLARIATECKSGAVKVVNHVRSVKYRLLEISRAAKSLTPANQERMKKSYEKLVDLTKRVVGQAGKVMKHFHEGKLAIVGSRLSVFAQMASIEHFVPLVRNVIHQTQERVFRGNTHVEGKIISLFEPHSQVIRKGKADKPNEFGRLVRIDEVENGIVSGYEVLEGNPADTGSFLPALEHHQSCFGRIPEMVTADRGFFSAHNEREAKKLGVKQVAIPARGRLSGKRAQHQKQRWFRRALRWRAGIERTMSHLKHPFSMARARYKADPGFQRYVGWCVITKNL
jgi:transposase, IS5 family